MRVHSHEVIIAGTRAEVTPRNNFVIRVADALWTRLGTLSVVPWETLSGPSSTLRSRPVELAKSSHGTSLSAEAEKSGDDQWPARTNLTMHRS